MQEVGWHSFPLFLRCFICTYFIISNYFICNLFLLHMGTFQISPFFSYSNSCFISVLHVFFFFFFFFWGGGCKEISSGAIPFLMLFLLFDSFSTIRFPPPPPRTCNGWGWHSFPLLSYLYIFYNLFIFFILFHFSPSCFWVYGTFHFPHLFQFFFFLFVTSFLGECEKMGVGGGGWAIQRIMSLFFSKLLFLKALGGVVVAQFLPFHLF